MELEPKLKNKYFVGAVVLTFPSSSNKFHIKFNAIRIFFIRETTPFSEWRLLCLQVADSTVGKNWSWLAQDGNWADVISTRQWRDITGGYQGNSDKWYPKVYMSYASNRNQSNATLYQNYGTLDKFHGILMVLSFIYGSLFFAKEAKAQHYADTLHDLNTGLEDVMQSINWAQTVDKTMKDAILKEITDIAYDSIAVPEQQQTKGREEDPGMRQVYNNSSGVHFKVPVEYAYRRGLKERAPLRDQERQRYAKEHDGKGYLIAPRRYGRVSSLFGR